jgi:hypothetical protein
MRGGKVSENTKIEWADHTFNQACVDITIKLRAPKGGEIEEWPAYLRVRQFPPTERH